MAGERALPLCGCWLANKRILVKIIEPDASGEVTDTLDDYDIWVRLIFSFMGAMAVTVDMSGDGARSVRCARDDHVWFKERVVASVMAYYSECRSRPRLRTG